ncbi:MAG: phosphotransferase [Bacilli bacterium]|nr:phosphotransferase [Bacilli bacterium]
MNRIYLKKLLTDVLGEGYVLESRLMGGMMNISYVVKDKDDKRYIIYLPNGKANKLVDRKVEKRNSDIMVNLNLTSKFIYFDELRGIKIKEYIEGESLNNIKDEEVDYQAVADLLHLIHDSKELCPNDYHPFERLANYENKAISFQKESNEYRELKDFLSLNFNKLATREKVFSHNDFQKSNILKGEDDKYYVIDFEFCGNNDPIYDIACFANDGVALGEKLLEHYYIKPTKEQYQRFYLWRIFVSLQWHNVAIAKHYQKEGKAANFNYLNVAKYFLGIAKEAQDKFLGL